MKLSKIPEWAILLALLAWSPMMMAGQAPLEQTPPELLEAADAFQPTARFLDPATIEINYQIADGYYMYRERFKFITESTATKLGKARLPKGKIKQDVNFGRVETYRQSVRILLLYTRPDKAQPESGSGRAIVVAATSQGCADAGICYPPQTHHFRLEGNSTQVVRPSGATSSGFTKGGAQAKPSEELPATSKFSDLIKPSR